MVDFNKTANLFANVNEGNLGDRPQVIESVSSGMHKCAPYGKAWDVGDQATVFYPFKYYSDEDRFYMHTSAYFGHEVSDRKVLGTSFLRSFSRITVNGDVLGNGDLAYQFSRISRLLVNAQKERELAELNSDGKDWSILGPSAYQQARKKIEDAYDTKNNMNAKRPLLGPLRVHRITEVVFVQMDPNSGTPLNNSAKGTKTGNYMQTIRDARLKKLESLANDVNYGILAQNPGLEPEEGKVYFLEVLYNYTSATNSKSEAGRSDPQGIAESLTIAKRSPDYAKTLQARFSRVPVDPEGIARHAYDMQPIEEQTLRAKLQSYLFERTSSLQYLSPDDKNLLVRQAALLDYLRIAPKEDPELTQRIEEALGHPIGATVDQASAPTLDSIVDAAGTPDFSLQSSKAPADLANIPADEAEDIFDGGTTIDFGALV